MDNNPDYSNLNPDLILSAVEDLGFFTDNTILALNSYENRVYQIGIEEDKPIIAKFYRPNRWTNEAIIEEHTFTEELFDLEIPVVPPLKINNKTLHEYKGYRFALFQKKGGGWPNLDDPETLYRIGMFIGRIHAIGSTRSFIHRHQISVQSYINEPLEIIKKNDFIPSYLHEAYFSTCSQIADIINQRLSDIGEIKLNRIHGDCHPGNILWTDTGAHIVDLDDCLNGPAIQDIWMLLSGDRAEMTAQLCEILDGYTQFNSFSAKELSLIEPLRAMRMIYYSGWLAKRWSDPAFPRNFPWFGTDKYWEDQILSLKEQISALQEEPLFWR